MTGPVNRVAARVMLPGVHYEPEYKGTPKHWENPPPTIRFVPQKNNSQSADMTGFKFGRFVVVGYLGQVGDSVGATKKYVTAEGKEARKEAKRQSVWLVKCACGDYEQRTVKRMKAGNAARECCAKCRALEHLKGSISDEALRRRDMVPDRSC